MVLTPEQLEEIRVRHAAAPVGPYRWTGYIGSHQIDLSSRHDSLMEFRRWGMRGAQPLFNTGGLLHKASELATPDTAPGRGRIADIDHPLARALAHSWEDVHALLTEVDRLNALLASREGEGQG